MKLINTKDINARPAALNDAWQRSEPFLLLPAIDSVSPKIVENLLQKLPQDIRTNSFALLTSGSTGAPRIVIGSKERAIALSQALHKRQDLEECKETVVVLPLTYGYAFINQWVWSLVHGRKLHITQGWSQPAALESALVDSSSAMICLVNSQVSLLETFFSKPFTSVTRINFAGARFPQERLETVRHYFPNARILNNYGCTEAMPRLTTRWEEESNQAENIGKPLPGVKLSTDDDNSLKFQSDYGALGYIDESGFHEFQDNEWIKSGDRAEQLPDDSWRLLGRTTDFLKRHGQKIPVPLVVSAILAVSGFEAEAYRCHDAHGEDGFVLVLQREPPPSTMNAIRKLLRDEFSRSYWPLRIECIDHFPYLANGKVDLVTLARVEGKRCLWSQKI